MTITKAEGAADVASRKSASLADVELDHLERMVQYVVRRTAADDTSQLDFEYWGKRLRALTQTHDLVATQRQRIIGLLDLLEREMLYRSRQTAA
ncbi:HWE histidine kinase [Paraburkholderia diazotrophica]|uniref:histidine kinase n=2 Tax=Paraburkholderia diazotrophica TaxID=667676 RepID=A0A1H6Y233_9BURK|nr:HWE histidine kinase [Paraburkholderia diazotrophica]